MLRVKFSIEGNVKRQTGNDDHRQRHLIFPTKFGMKSSLSRELGIMLSLI